jgi:glutamyl-Q tRNA(Asp) synthetase
MVSRPTTYVGRFAPSPSGPLHLGSVVAAMASWLDARAHGGQWLVRMEDVDQPRTVPGADAVILEQLRRLGFRHDGQVWWQSRRFDAYQSAFDRLAQQDLVYGCACTRREIADSRLSLSGGKPDTVPPYPGTCRHGLAPGRTPRAWRLRVPEGRVCFEDRWAGLQCQDVEREVGDFVLRRADGQWAYQLAVVVDDGAQGISHIVRGADLLDSTARQYVLDDLLDLPRPVVMHVPLVTAVDGRKLSKQNGAPAVDTERPLDTLMAAWTTLGFAAFECRDVGVFWESATCRWAQRWDIRPA